MALEIKVPTLGESVTEATVGQWLKKQGDAVARDEPLVELETDKVTIEVPAPAAGRLETIAVKDGETVARRRAARHAGRRRGRQGRADQGRAGSAAAESRAEEACGAAKAAAAAAAEAGRRGRRRAGPADARRCRRRPRPRKLMEEKGVVAGRRRRQRQARPDPEGRRAGGARRARQAGARAGAAQARAPAAPGDEAREQRVTMTRLRQTIARRLKEAQNKAAMLTTFNDVDMSAVMELRKTYREIFEKKHGVRLGFMGFFVKACVQALKDIPGRQRRDRRRRHRLQELLPHRRRGRHREGARRAGRPRRAGPVDRRRREDDQRFRQARPRRQADDRGDAGRHLHHLQRRRLRLADVDADPERPAIRHSRHAPHRGAAGRAQRRRSSSAR